MTIIRVARVIGMPIENLAEYEDYHANVWPEVIEALARSNVRNFSIHHVGELLFSYFEYVGDDFTSDMELLDSDPVSRRWVALQNRLQRPLADSGGDWMTLRELFHHDLSGLS